MKTLSNTINNRAMSMVELMVVIAIFSIMILAGSMVLNSGRGTWFTTEAQITLQNNLRQALERISKELRETGSDNAGNMKLTIYDGTGVGNSDILRFSVPVICQVGTNIINSSGDVSYWGAPLTWGCTSASCMDADNSCSTVDYRYIEYALDAENRLIRRVLNNSLNAVNSVVFAQDVIDMQAVLSVDERIVTLTVNTRTKTQHNKTMDLSRTQDVYLRNRS